MPLESIKQAIAASIEVKKSILENGAFLEKISAAASLMTAAFQADKKVLFCGNGGTAADAQHLAAELSGRFYFNRPPLFAEALHVNSSYLTAVGNDFGFEHSYSRMVEAAGRAGDLLVVISTSGNSPNILNAIFAAKKQGMTVIGLTGETGGKLAAEVDLLLNVPSKDTPRIQESHILIGHILCELVEKNLFSPANPPNRKP